MNELHYRETLTRNCARPELIVCDSPFLSSFFTGRDRPVYQKYVVACTFNGHIQEQE